MRMITLELPRRQNSGSQRTHSLVRDPMQHSVVIAADQCQIVQSRQSFSAYFTERRDVVAFHEAKSHVTIESLKVESATLTFQSPGCQQNQLFLRSGKTGTPRYLRTERISVTSRRSLVSPRSANTEPSRFTFQCAGTSPNQGAVESRYSEYGWSPSIMLWLPP